MQIYVMFIITNLIEPRMGKLILNHLIENSCPELAMDFWAVVFFKLTLRSDCLELYFGTVAFITILTWLVILQKYQPLSNQSFKHNWKQMPSLSLTPKLSFEPRFCMFIINDYYTKSERIQSLDSLFPIISGLNSRSTFICALIRTPIKTFCDCEMEGA